MSGRPEAGSAYGVVVRPVAKPVVGRTGQPWACVTEKSYDHVVRRTHRHSVGRPKT